MNTAHIKYSVESHHILWHALPIAQFHNNIFDTIRGFFITYQTLYMHIRVLTRKLLFGGEAQARV